MKILSINTKLTKDLGKVAFNVDSPIDEDVLIELNMTDLKITKIDECIFFEGLSGSGSIKEIDVSNFHSKYNAMKDHKDATQKI